MPNPPDVLAAPVHMDQPVSYLHWGVIQISPTNAIVILLMIVVFVLALFLPFPGRHRQ